MLAKLFGGQAAINGPGWSPDSLRIAFSSFPDFARCETNPHSFDPMKQPVLIMLCLLPMGMTAIAQDAPAPAATSGLPPVPSALSIPKPGPVSDAPYAPQPILQ